MLKTFAIGLLAIGISGCVSSTGGVTATEGELCQTWGESLPTRSRSDTEQTQQEITRAYADFANACPTRLDLLPE
jgi:hypothetical protein